MKAMAEDSRSGIEFATVTSAEAVRAAVTTARRARRAIAFVPTMGNLHAGHLRLIEVARADDSFVVASIYVNPTQFGPGEDLASYPRTPEADETALRSAGCDLLFAPTVDVVYPHGLEAAVRVEVPGLSTVLCGEHRPGHFDGVASVVLRLFNLVKPDVAVFGRKDLQQLIMIRRMVADLSLPIRITGVDTVREADGLAMSSRNGYLDTPSRAKAASIHRTLLGMRKRLAAGEAAKSVERWATTVLEADGFTVDYTAIRRSADLAEPLASEQPNDWVGLVAATIGRTRLIDNLSMALNFTKT